VVILSCTSTAARLQCAWTLHDVKESKKYGAGRWGVDLRASMDGFWHVEFSKSRLGVSHLSTDSVVLGLGSSLLLRKYSWPCHTEVPSKWTSTPCHFATPSRPVRQLRWLLHWWPKSKQPTVTCILGKRVGQSEIQILKSYQFDTTVYW
jgi:hypothetical protein